MLARHCKTLFMKQVLSIFSSPVVPLGMTEEAGPLQSEEEEEGEEGLMKCDADTRISLLTGEAIHIGV